MSYSATIKSSGTDYIGRYESLGDAWGSLMDFHQDLLDDANKGEDRVLRRMELRRSSGITGAVSGPDPLDPSETVTYSVQDW